MFQTLVTFEKYPELKLTNTLNQQSFQTFHLIKKAQNKSFFILTILLKKQVHLAFLFFKNYL
jgi:hypothetical protein